jgi:small-conductance mechanosensitive channel
LDRPFWVLGFAVPIWIVVPAFYLTWVIVGWIVKRTVFAWLRHVTSRTQTKLDDVLINAADLPITIMIFVWGVAALVHFLGPAYTGRWPHAVTTACKATTLLALIFFVDRILQQALHYSSSKYEVVRFSQGIGSVLIHALVFCIGGLMLLDSVGVSITPVIASLGLGSLAVALALQPTLENFISGFQILIDQPIRPGHYIRLESGEEGFVEKIGWRSTWVRQGVNNMIIMPNKMLVNARLMNFDLPSSDLIVTVPIGVHYASDLEKVERVTLEVAREILKRVPGAVPDFVPVVRFNKFSASSIDFVAVLRAKSFPDSGLVVHEFMKAVTARFSRENIVMPFPIVALNTAQEGAIFKPS